MSKGGDRKAVLITGGAGFIGTNLADQLASSGRRVRVLDNLSRPGVEKNLAWLKETHGERIQFEKADVRDPFAVRRAMAGVEAVFHFAAQVAVTTSLEDPVHDFEVNARGTVNVLEAARSAGDTETEPPVVIFTSTNKVYGGLEDVPLRLDGLRYEPVDAAIRTRGLSEERRLDFHSPYGSSKGAADQYVLDYARSYGLRTAVFRMSCIYGPHQFGNEDQGWVAHFILRALEGRPLTLYGDGMQVRDILYAEDLVRAFLLAWQKIDTIQGQAFNIGGGAANTISLLELIDEIARLHGGRPKVFFESWRTGDQRYYVSDTRRFEAATGWRPHVNVREGVSSLYNWLAESPGAVTAAEPFVAAARRA